MASDAVSLIMQDHRVMEQIFDRLQSGEGDRRKLLNECAARLTAHSHAEEQKVYPALAEMDPSERDEVHHGADEHHEAEKMLHQLQQMKLDGAEFEAKLTEFIDAVKHHIEEEESEILPALAEAVDAPTLRELGEAFEAVRLEELKVAGITEQVLVAGDDVDADAMSRDELYEKAKEADIPGRSTMNKEQLSEALRNRKA